MAVPAQAQAPAEGVDPAAFGPPAPQPFDFEQVATLAQERSARLYVQPGYHRRLNAPDVDRGAYL